MKFSESLKKNQDFKKVYNEGKSFANRYLVMYVIKNDKNMNRLGISVSKKVGNSIVRHRLSRLVRESYRLEEENFSCGIDIVIICRVSAKDADYKKIKDALVHLAGLHDVIKKSEYEKIIKKSND